MNYRDKQFLRATCFIGAFAIAIVVVIIGVVKLFFT